MIGSDGCLGVERIPAHPATGQAAPAGMPRVALGQFALGGLAFLALTIGAVWYQVTRIGPGTAGPTWGDLRWRYGTMILLCLPIETVASSLRTWLLLRVLEPGVSFWTCVKAEWANVAVSLLTPSQSGGGLGQVYLLHRGGASVGTAVTVSLLSFLGTMVALFGLGLHVLGVSGAGGAGPLLRSAVWSLTAIAALMLLAAACPQLLRAVLARGSRVIARRLGREATLVPWWPPRGDRTGPPADRMDRLTARLADLVSTFGDDVRRFLGQGGAGVTFAAVCLLSTAFLTARALLPFLCIRFLGLDGGTLGEVVSAQLALIFLVFFAPTPGGAGIAESAALSITADLVPSGFVPHYTLLWRVSTAYLAALAGLLCLLRVLARDAQRVARSRAGGSTPRNSTTGDTP
jgi:hypothetical protein